jgi:hypothetical protein
LASKLYSVFFCNYIKKSCYMVTGFLSIRLILQLT